MVGHAAPFRSGSPCDWDPFNRGRRIILHLGSLKAFYKKKDMTGSNHLGIPLNLFHKRKKRRDLAITCVRIFQGTMSFHSFGGNDGGALADEHAKNKFFEANPLADLRWGWKQGGFKSFNDVHIAASLKRGLSGEAGGMLRAEYLKSMQEALYSTWEEANAEREEAEAAAAAAAVAVAFEDNEEHGVEIDDAGDALPLLPWDDAMELLRQPLTNEFKDLQRFERGHMLCPWSPVGCTNMKRRMGGSWDPVARTFNPSSHRLRNA